MVPPSDDRQTGPEQRRYPRFDTDVPVSFTLSEVVASESAYLNNISEGGAAFNALIELQPGTVIMMHFPPTRPVLRTPARVVWCRQMAFQHVVGVEFTSSDQVFRRQLVQAIREIENFRAVSARAGRVLSGQQATLEWFERHASDYFGSK